MKIIAVIFYRKHSLRYQLDIIPTKKVVLVNSENVILSFLEIRQLIQRIWFRTLKVCAAEIAVILNTQRVHSFWIISTMNLIPQFEKVAKRCMCLCLCGEVINTCFHLDLIIIWVCCSLCIQNEWYSFRLFFFVYHSSFLPFVLCLFFVYLHPFLPFSFNRISDMKGISLVKNSD